MKDELHRRLEKCGNLPTLPGVAVQIIQLCQDPDADLHRMAETISLDPALSAAILRIVNSAYYGLSREIATLDHAVRLLGIDRVRTLALSFSIFGTLRQRHKGAGRLTTFWRRSLISGVAARSLVRWAKTSDEGVLIESEMLQGNGAPALEDEVLFLAGLLQDIGILVLREAFGEEYEEIFAQSGDDHLRLIELEKEQLGADHGEVGAWMARQWRLPEIFEFSLRGSHQPHQIEVSPELRITLRIVALSGLLADIWVMEDPTMATQYAMANATEMLDMDDEAVRNLLRTIADSLPETSNLFKIDVGDTDALNRILEQAQSALMEAEIQEVHESENIRLAAAQLKPHLPASNVEEDSFDLTEQASGQP